MNTRRLQRMAFLNFVSFAMKFILWGLSLWFGVMAWQSFAMTEKLTTALQQAEGLSTALLTWELGAPPLVSKSAAKVLLPLEPGMHPERSVSEFPAPPVDEVEEIDPPALHKEEPGLSHSEHADDMPIDTASPPPVTEPADAPIEVTLTAGSGSNFLTGGGITIRNETTIAVDMNKVLSRQLTLQLPKGKPQILIVHTHGSEAFWGYDTDGVTVIELGTYLTELLEAQGFEVIHDTTAYNLPDFNKSYSNALAGITKTLETYPSIQMVLDIHRDAIEAADGAIRKPVTTIDGESVAQMMFVVGTNNSGLFHDNWPLNLCLAVRLQQALAADGSDLMRPINLRKERFNQHATHGSLILEVGAQGNDSEEAMRAIKLFAQKAAPVLQTLIQ